MGLRDRMVAAYAARDIDAELQACLGPADVLQGFARGATAAPRRHRIDARLDMTSMLVGGMKEELAKARHIGGEKGSLAQELPRDARNRGLLVLSDSGFSVWHVDYGEPPAPAFCSLRLPREVLTGLSRPGGRVRRGYELMRMEFRDGSFFDYLVLADGSTQDFWDAAGAFRPA